MKLLNLVVCLRQVPDPRSVEIDPLSGALDLSRLVYITNPADLEGLELALTWRERLGGTVWAVSCGPAGVEPVLRDALARGADRVMRVWSPALSDAAPAQTAAALAAYIRPLEPRLVLCGQRSLARASGQVPGRLAGLLGLPQATGIVRAELEQAHSLLVERKLERGRRERLRLALPALLGLESGQVEPRYAALPDLMRAARAALPVWEAPAPAPGRLRLVRAGPPRPRPRRIFMPDPDLPALARIEAILNAGAAAVRRGDPLEGPPEVQAGRLLDFLEQRGFLPSNEDGR